MSDHQQLLLIWAITTLGTSLQIYETVRGICTRARQRQAHARMQRHMESTMQSVVATITRDIQSAQDQDAPRVH